MKKIDKFWYEVYANINLYGGKLETISDDDEDMLTITYQNGLMIDVGYIQSENTYYITVVTDDSIEGWKNPINVVEVRNKDSLVVEIQNVILKYCN